MKIFQNLGKNSRKNISKILQEFSNLRLEVFQKKKFWKTSIRTSCRNIKKNCWMKFLNLEQLKTISGEVLDGTFFRSSRTNTDSFPKLFVEEYLQDLLKKFPKEFMKGLSKEPLKKYPEKLLKIFVKELLETCPNTSRNSWKKIKIISWRNIRRHSQIYFRKNFWKNFRILRENHVWTYGSSKSTPR